MNNKISGMYSESTALGMPLLTVASFADAIGLELTVLKAQISRGYWPTVKVGKRLFVNVEVIRTLAAKKNEHFTL